MRQKYAKLEHGAVWHIYVGGFRFDLFYPEPQSLCGVVLPELTTDFIIDRPVTFGMCNRCLSIERRDG